MDANQSSGGGLNINAKPFVPSFVTQQQRTQQPPTAPAGPGTSAAPSGGSLRPQHQQPAYAQRPVAVAFPPLPHFAPPPPPLAGPSYAGLFAPQRVLYPGLAGSGTPVAMQQQQQQPATPPPAAVVRPTYEQMLRSRGTPDSKILTPTETPPPQPSSASAGSKAPSMPDNRLAAARTSTGTSVGRTGTAPSVAPQAKFGPEVLDRALALLFLGPRGSGKSTQARLVAEKLNLLFVSAGDLVREKKQPFVELRRLVDEHFGDAAAAKSGNGGATRSYRGVALDRYIVNGEEDVHYLQWALGPRFALPRVFLLMLDWETALARADARTDELQRAKSTQRRLMEYRAHFDACENLYAPAGCLDRVDCEDHSPAAVHDLVMSRLEHHFREHVLYVPLHKLPPRYFVKDVVSVRLVSDVDRMLRLKADVQALLATPSPDVAPISQMSGVVDGALLKDTRARRALSAYFVTLKADGQRIIVVKHRVFGLLGLPQKYTCVYDMSALFAAIEWPSGGGDGSTDNATSVKGEEEAKSPVEFIFDAELVKTEGKAAPTVYVFDFIYFYGTKATSERFGLRLERLRTFFDRVRTAEHAPRVLQLKAYALAGQLRHMLPDYTSPPFAVDGVVFQPDTNYRYGMDKTIFKWKPQEQCTVDFRLYGCREPEQKGGDYQFDAKVNQEFRSDGGERTFEEVTLPNVVVHVPAAAVLAHQLSDGAIVECVKRSTKPSSPPPPQGATTANTTPVKKQKGKAAVEETPTQPVAAPATAASNANTAAVWVFHRNRPDKLVPNKAEVFEKINVMEHTTYDTLLALCDTFK